MYIYEPKPTIIHAIPESGHCVIEASAGTGKTFTIQKIFLDLLLKGKQVQDFLIMTFTRKATAELHERLYKVLRETLDKPPAKDAPTDIENYWVIGDAEKHILEVALHHFHRAQISTIDSLTQRILRENLDISLAQSDATVQAQVPTLQAFEYFTRVVVPQDDDLIAMMAAYKHYYNDPLDNLEIKTEYISTKGSLYKDLTEYTKQRADKITGIIFPPGILSPQALFEQYKIWFEIVRKRIQTQENGIQTLEWENIKSYCLSKLGKNPVKDLINQIENFYHEMKDAKSYDWLRMASFSYQFSKNKNLKANVIQNYRSLNHSDSFYEALFSVLFYGFSEKYFVAEYAVNKYRDCMQKFHIEQAAYQFDTYTDLLCETLRSSDGEALASRLRRKWKIVIVDEFQDTSPEQWEILERCFLHHENESRLFLIGDPKQAIYAFRGGDIYTYKKAVQDIREKFGEDHVLALTSNYRSTPDILEAINQLYYRRDDDDRTALFSQISKEKAEQYDYRNIYSHEISAGHEDWQCLNANGDPCSAISLIPIDDSEGRQKDWNERLADAITAEIRCYRDGACPLFQKGRTREQFKKIYVLAYQKSEFDLLKKRLVMEGIPFDSSAIDDDNNIYTEPEILELTRIMMAISNPDKPGYLEAALHTTFFGFNTYDVACHIHAKESRIKEQFRLWSEMSRHAQKFSLIFDEILSFTQYASRLALFSYTQEPYRRVCNVMDELCERALYDDLDWDGLLDWMHQVRKNEICTTPMKNMEPDVLVQFMTIHKCKGLEADAVFLLYPREYTAYSIAVKDVNARCYHVFEDKRWRRVMRPPETSIQTLEAAYFEASQETERLLYVALTRAAARLYLPRYLSIDSGSGNMELKICSKNITFPDIHLRLQRTLCCLYGKAIPKDMLPFFASWHKSKHKALSTDEAYSRLKQIKTNVISDKSDDNKTEYKSQQISSYSSLKHNSQKYHGVTSKLVPDAWHTPISPKPEMRWPDLPKGRHTGLFLHAVLERISYEAVNRLRNKTSQTWLDDEQSADVREICRVFEKCAREFQFSDRAVAAAQQIVFLTLTTPQAIFAPSGLCAVEEHQSEVSFLIRYDKFTAEENRNDAELCAFFKQAIGNADFALKDRDFLIGSIDCCYRIGKTWYILDWKSDCLDCYSPEYLKSYVKDHYDYQVAIYRHAFKRIMHTMLDENSLYRFGGMVYVFIRGISSDNHDGFVFLPETEEDL